MDGRSEGSEVGWSEGCADGAEDGFLLG